MEKHFLYARQCSPLEGRKPSVKEQLRMLRAEAKKKQLCVAGEIIDTSVHHPKQPLLKEVMRRIEAGEASGVLIHTAVASPPLW